MGRTIAAPHRLAGGRWQIRWIDAQGRRQARSYRTEREARERLRDFQSMAGRVRDGLAPAGSEVAGRTLAEVVPAWLDTRPPKRRRDDESRLRTHILPQLGAGRLRDIDTDALERFARHLESTHASHTVVRREDSERRVERVAGQGTLKPMTVKNCLNLVCKILHDHKLPARVTYKVPTSGYAWIESPQDVAKFLAACEPPWFQVAAALSAYGGLRQGEVAGLPRGALDFDRGLIRVDKSYTGPVKSKHMRWAPLSPALAEVLKPWLLAHPGELAVTREDGGMIAEEHGTLAGFTRRACKRAGVATVTYHQLRHTCASHLAQRIPLPLVGAVLGHADPKTTARYAHLNPEAVARDPRLHLDFTAPAGAKVIPIGNRHDMARRRR